MPAKKLRDKTPFERSYNEAQGIQLSTPYAVVSVSQDGRRFTIQLWEDVRQSIHNKALFSYYQQLVKRGVLKVNCDHLDLRALDRSLDLARGKARLDLAYIHRGKLHEVELKTHREVGLDRTRIQLTELAPHCENLIVVVPRQDMEDMLTILAMIQLDKKVTVDTYEIYEEEGEGNNGD